MNEENDTTKTDREDKREPKAVQVLTRFERDELEAMKDETGALADATAAACFVRKNLRKRD